MATDRYSGYTASIVTSGPTTTNFLQVVGHAITPGSNKERTTPAGALDPGAAILNMADAGVSLTLEDLVTLFGIVSISAGIATTTATFRHQQRTTGGTFTGGSNNVTFTSTGGFAYLTRLSARQDSPARAEVMFKPHWDGSTEPIVRNTGVAFSGIAPAFVSLFYLGPVYVNSVLLEGIQEVSIDPGINYSTVRANGDPYARVGSIIARQPTITFTTLDQESTVLETLFNDGLAGTIACYFRKGADGSARVTDVTASHCKVSAASGSWSPDNVSVSETGDGLTSITVQPTTTLAAVVNSAIP